MKIQHLIDRAIRYAVDKNYRFCIDAGLGKYKNLPDEEYLRRLYKARLGRELNLENPKGFNEKLQWLKIHDRKSQYTMMVDKYEAKQYVAKIIGKEHIIPTLGVWNKFDDINFDELPNQFVLKCTHDSGGLVICNDKKGFDKNAAKKKINQCLKRNFYWYGREWPYKNVPPRIIAEKYMEDNLSDYKLFCFDGVPHLTLVCSGRFTKDGLKEDFYDNAWNHIDMQRSDHCNATYSIRMPNQFDQMKALAMKLSKNIPFARVDFYEADETVYFGEITFYPASGFEGFKPDEWDEKLGKLIVLPKENGGGYLIRNEGYTLLIHENYAKQYADLKDYKFYCFDGKMRFVMINTDRNSAVATKADYFDRDFNWLDFTWGYEHAEKRPQKPDRFEEMISIAEMLAQGLPHIRIDLYECNGQIYFGELTFFDGSGFDKIEPMEWDYRIGEMLQLPSKQ